MGLFEDFKDESMPGGPESAYVPDFDQTEDRDPQDRPRDFDHEEERKQPDKPLDFDPLEPDRAEAQVPRSFDQEEADRPDPDTPRAFDQTERDREQPDQTSPFSQEEPDRPSPEVPESFGQEGPDRTQPEQPRDFDQTESGRSQQDPGEFDQTEGDREHQDPGTFSQEDPNRPEPQDPGAFGQEEADRPEPQDPGSFDQEEDRPEPGGVSRFEQTEDRSDPSEPGRFQQEEEREQPDAPRDFQQTERERENPDRPRGFDQSENRGSVERPSDFEQRESNRAGAEEPRRFDQTEERQSPEEPPGFDQTEERSEPQPPRDFDQTEGDRTSPEEPRGFDQTESGRGEPGQPPDFEQTENRPDPRQPPDFEQTEGVRESSEIRDFDQEEGDRFQPVAPKGFQQTLDSRDGQRVPDFGQRESNRQQPDQPREFEQAERDRTSPEEPREFDQTESREGETVPGFEQREDDRFRPQERPDFEQREGGRPAPDAPTEFEQEESDREQPPELSFGGGGRLAELRQRAEDDTLDRWKSYKNAIGAPFVLTRPDEGSLDVPAGEHNVPGRKLAEHLERQTKFSATPKGALFNITQGALQVQNPRQETRVYNPAAGFASAAPGVNVDRHAGGLDWEDEIRERTGGEGYLRQLTGGAEGIGESTGALYRGRMRQLLASNMPEKNPNKWSRVPEGPELLAAETERAIGGEYDVFLGMFEYEGPDGQSRFDAYNPTTPYTSVDGNVETADGVPSINQPDGTDRYKTLSERNNDARVEADQNPDQFRLGEGRIPFRRPEEIPGPRAIGGDDPPGPYVSDNQEAEKFRENQVGDGGGEFVLHQLPDDDDRVTHGLPNQSLSGLGTDQINALPIEDYDPGAAEEPVLETERGENRQLADFRIYDRINRKRLVFRAYLEGLSISHDIDWSSERYSGRPEQYHIYGGASRSVDFSFTAFAESEAAFEAMWNKVNYLEGMVYPAAFAELGDQGGGAYMVAPFAELTIGSFFRQQPGFIESLDMDINDDYPWETEPGRQLTKGVDVSVSYTVIEEDLPRVGDELVKADFITDVNGD